MAGADAKQRGRRGSLGLGALALAAVAALALAAVAALALAAVAAVLLWWSRPQPVPDPAVPAATRPAIVVLAAGEATIAAHAGTQATVFRMRDNPRIVVIDFPDLTAQGLAMNRIAAFVEKAATPRDRALDDAALAQAVSADGETIESYYDGHDYGAADLRRFFAAVDRDGIGLNADERFIRHLAGQDGMLDPQGAGAVLTIPQATEGGITAHARRIILRHELSHGEFFTNPAYAAFATQAWRTILTPPQRVAFRDFLAANGYDIANEELVVNEMQAFLLFTPDARIVSAARLGMTETELAALRQRLLDAMPAGWLRELATAPLP